MHRKLIITISSVVLFLIILLAAGWVWVLLARNPLSVPVATWLPWPVACSTRGCITTREWQYQHVATEVFAHLAAREQPTPVQSLQTLIRQHLAHYGQLTSSVTPAAAQRYRSEILHATDEAKIKEATGLSLAGYDELVVMPFLEQESLRQQRRAESPDDLYKQLASERWVAVLPWHLTWDKGEGKVVEN